jgi:aromatic ring hydroxylase
MALRTAAEYVASLRDGRSVFYRGTRVEDVTTHPALRVAIDHAAIDYRMAEDPRWHDLRGVSRRRSSPSSASTTRSPRGVLRVVSPACHSSDARGRRSRLSGLRGVCA